jgi:hypothetical protein
MLGYATRVRLILAITSILFTVTNAAAQQRADFGTLSIQVRPPDAEIFIDGERWTGSEGTAPLQVQLAPGAHRVEIRSAGRHTFTSEVTIRAGQTTPLNVSLVQTEAPEPAAAPAPPRTTSQPARPSESGIDIKTGEDGFMIAPDYRVTEINHSTAHLIGAYGGYVFGGQMLIGGGGYWQANDTNGTHIAYAGPVFEWRVFPDKTVGFNLHGLIGGGWQYADDSFFAPFDGPRIDHHDARPTHGFGVPYHFHDDAFFVAEPEAQVVVRLASWIRLQGGAGYRATSSDGLSGASGSVSVQLGR